MLGVQLNKKPTQLTRLIISAQILFAFLFLFSSPFNSAKAHFNHFEPRIIHIAEDAGDLFIYLRMPLPLLLLPDDWKGGDTTQDIPFTTKRTAAGKTEYDLNKTEVTTNTANLIQLIKQGYKVTINQKPITDYETVNISIFTSHNRKPFSSLAYAQKALEGPLIKIIPGEFSIFNASIDVKIKIPNHSVTSDITISSDLGSKFKALDRLANITQLHRTNTPEGQTTIGLLKASFGKTPERLSQITNQTLSGIWHIIIGLDHVLFVMLIIILAGSWSTVLKNATGFTIGHSITLTLGMLGQTPEGTWFIPAVELAIAITILYGAMLLLLNKPSYFGFSNVMMIGLIHGYGFSFVLSDVLKQGGAIDFSNIFFFNLGIELGQIIIYASLLPLFYLAHRFKVLQKIPAKLLFSLLAASISLYWIADRGYSLWQTLA